MAGVLGYCGVLEGEFEYDGGGNVGVAPWLKGVVGVLALA